MQPNVCYESLRTVSYFHTEQPFLYTWHFFVRQFVLLKIENKKKKKFMADRTLIQASIVSCEIFGFIS